MGVGHGFRAWNPHVPALGFMTLLLALVPWFSGPYATTFVFTLLVALILAQSWSWIGGGMGYINLGHFVFYGLGAYAFAICLTHGFPIVAAFVAAGVIGVIAAAFLSLPLFRLRGDYFAFATLALLPLAQVLASDLTPITNGADGISLPAANVVLRAFYIALGLASISVIATMWLGTSRFGLMINAIRDDEGAVGLLKVRTGRVKTEVLLLSALFAALAGAVQAWQLSYIDPGTVFGLDPGLMPIAMALLGGAEMLWGPAVGVAILGSAQQLLIVHAGILSTALIGLIILLVGRFLPGGVLSISGQKWVAALHRLNTRPRSTDEGDNAATVRSATFVGEITDLPLRPTRSADRASLLRCRGLTMTFGGNTVIRDVNFEVEEGEIVALVGPNGAGKSTLFNCISGVYRPSHGEVLFGNACVGRMRADHIAEMGIGRTYQNPRPFYDLNVQENIAIPLLRQGARRISRRDALEGALPFASYVGLGHRVTTRAAELTLQERKALELGRALACHPRLLLIDEVASGLMPSEIEDFVRRVADMRDRYGVTIIWVEHIFSALAEVADRVLALDHGTVIADGPLQTVVSDPAVVSAYLGKAA